MLYVAAIFFIFHLIFEAFAIFIRYNFAAYRQPMRGANISNVTAIISRGFIALYGLIVSISIENHGNSLDFFYCLMTGALVISSLLSKFLSSCKLSIDGLEKLHLNILLKKNSYEKYKYNQENVKIPVIFSIFIGFQFVAIVFSYGLCYIFFDYRLTIISFSPLFSMLGSLITVLLIEPSLADTVDRDVSKAYDVCSSYLNARAISFAFSAFILTILFAFAKVSSIAFT